MKNLRIGEIARLVGTPSSALRFWEDAGIVEPAKDADNNYRTYSPTEACRFLLAKRYRSFGFTLPQTRSMIEADTGSGNSARFDRQAEKLDAEIARLSAIRAELSSHKAECERARDRIGLFSPCVLPASYYIFAIDSGQLVSSDGVGDMTRALMRWLPFVTYSLIIPRGALVGLDPFTCKWGYGMSEDLISRADRKIKEGAEYYPERDCIFTAFERGDPRDMKMSELGGIVDACRAAGFDISGPAIGHLLGSTSSSSGAKYLYSLYIPIKK